MIALLALLALADPAQVWTGADLSKRLAAAAPEAHQVSGTTLGRYRGYRLSANQRKASGIAELHLKVDDVFVIESGEATLITGGTVVSPRTSAPGEVRGSSIQGGTKRKVAAGDFVHIPANTPHQFVLEEGKQITYAVVKVDAQ